MEFSWKSIHHDAFCKLKQLLISVPVLAFPGFARVEALFWRLMLLGWGLVLFWLNHMRIEQYTQLHMLVEFSSNMKICYHRTRSTRYHVGNKTFPPLSLWTSL